MYIFGQERLQAMQNTQQQNKLPEGPFDACMLRNASYASPAMPCPESTQQKPHQKMTNWFPRRCPRSSVVECSHILTRTSAPGIYDACSGCVMLGVWTPGFSVWDAISRTLVALSPPVCTLMPSARRASSFCPFAAWSIGDVVLSVELCLSFGGCNHDTLVHRTTRR